MTVLLTHDYPPPPPTHPSFLSSLLCDAVQLAALSAAQLAALTPAHILALSPAQLAALTAAQVAGISVRCLNRFTPEQLAALGPDKARLVGTLPAPGGWVLDMPWRARYEWAPAVMTERVPGAMAAARAAAARAALDASAAQEVEEVEELTLVLVEEPGEDRFWRAADVAAMMVLDEEDWGEEQGGGCGAPPPLAGLCMCTCVCVCVCVPMDLKTVPIVSLVAGEGGNKEDYIC